MFDLGNYSLITLSCLHPLSIIIGGEDITGERPGPVVTIFGLPLTGIETQQPVVLASACPVF